jgi:hypothetical protein
MRQRSAIALALGLAVVSGCALWPSADERKETIERGVEQFSDNFQWQRWPQAAKQVHPDDRVAFLMFGSQLGDRLRVTSFEIAGVELDESGDAAHATVVFQVYRPPSLTEQTLVDRQRWERKGGEWFLRPALDRY